MTTDGGLRVTREQLRIEIAKERGFKFYRDEFGKLECWMGTVEQQSFFKSLAMQPTAIADGDDVSKAMAAFADPTTDVAAAFKLLQEMRQLQPTLQPYAANGWSLEITLSVNGECDEWEFISSEIGIVTCLAYLSWKRGVRVELVSEGE